MNKQENYLDELLNSVNREEKRKELTNTDMDFMRELKVAIRADSEEDETKAKTKKRISVT